MTKRSYEEFAELVQDYEPHEIVSNLKKMGEPWYSKIISDPKLLQDLKSLKMRLTSQLYKAYRHLLTQRHWDVVSKEAKNELWLNTMEYMTLPDRIHVRSLPRDAFLLAFEQAMLSAWQGLVMKRFAANLSTESTVSNLPITGSSAMGTAGGGDALFPTCPSPTTSYDPTHKKYSDHMSSFSTWLNHGDREDVENEALLAEARRIRFRRYIPVDENAENVSELRFLGEKRTDQDKNTDQLTTDPEAVIEASPKPRIKEKNHTPNPPAQSPTQSVKSATQMLSSHNRTHIPSSPSDKKISNRDMSSDSSIKPMAPSSDQGQTHKPTSSSILVLKPKANQSLINLMNLLNSCPDGENQSPSFRKYDRRSKSNIPSPTAASQAKQRSNRTLDPAMVDSSPVASNSLAKRTHTVRKERGLERDSA